MRCLLAAAQQDAAPFKLVHINTVAKCCYMPLSQHMLLLYAAATA